MGWKRMGLLLMFNRWWASVLVQRFCSFFKSSSLSAFQSVVCVSATSSVSTPLLLRKAHWGIVCWPLPWDTEWRMMIDGGVNASLWLQRYLKLKPGWLRAWRQRARSPRWLTRGGLPEESKDRAQRHSREDKCRRENQSGWNRERDLF